MSARRLTPGAPVRTPRATFFGLRLGLKLGLITLLLAVSLPLAAATPSVMNFSGHLGNDAGDYTGEVTVTLTLYDDPLSMEEAHALWAESHHLYVLAGRFHAMLGADPANPLPGALLDSVALYVGVRIGEDEEMLPRLRVASVPFALKAGDADSLGGMTLEGLADAFAEATHSHDLSALGGVLAAAQLPSDLVVEQELDLALLAKAEAAHGHDDTYVNIGQAASVSGDMLVVASVSLQHLADAGCDDGQMLAWFQGAWACADDKDTQNTYSGADFALASQSCSEAQKVTGFDGAGALLCGDDLDTKNTYSGADFALSSQSCEGSDKVAGVDASGALLCAPDVDMTNSYDGTDFAVSDQSCPEGERVTGFDGTGAVVCVVDTDSTYSGADFALADQGCPEGQKLTGLSETGAILCAEDSDSTYTGADFALSNQACAEGQVLTKITDTGAFVCSSDQDTTYQAGTGLNLDGTFFRLDEDYASAVARAAAYDSPGEIKAVFPDLDTQASNDLTTSTVFQGEVSGSYTNLQLAIGQIRDEHISFSAAINPIKIAGTAWTTGNDGPGSGLDADLLDGQHAAAFAGAVHEHGLRVITVRPVIEGGAPNAQKSGDALLAALSSVAGSEGDRYAIELEPGIFDLQGQRLVMKPFVDIVGAGTGSSYIVSDGMANQSDHATIVGAANAALRHVSVYNRGAGKASSVAFSGNGVNTRIEHVQLIADGASEQVIGAALRNGAEVVMRHVEISATSNLAGCRGVQAYGSDVQLHDLTIGVEGQNPSYGFVSTSASPQLRDVLIVARGAGTVYGLSWQNGDTPILRDVKVYASGTGDALGVYGLYGVGGTPDMSGVSVHANVEGPGNNSGNGVYLDDVDGALIPGLYATVSGSDTARAVSTKGCLNTTFTQLTAYAVSNKTATALFTENSSVNIAHGSLTAEGASTGVGAWNTSGSGTLGRLRIDQSTIAGTDYAVIGSLAGLCQIGMSRLKGDVSQATCAAVYDDTYNFYPDSCPPID